MIVKTSKWSELLNRTIKLHIHLPEDYYNCQDRYPVMYMFDGQNLFEDDQATFGVSWRLEDFLNQYKKELIIVGLECDHSGTNRLHEYTPYPEEETFFGPASGKGSKLLQWMVENLKPAIDCSYRTWPHREATGIGGSSMGGLMAMYGVVRHNDVFSKAACLSPSIQVCLDSLSADFFYRPIDADTRIYWSFGTKELQGKDRIFAERQLDEFLEGLQARNGAGKVVLQEGGRHNEQSWSAQNGEYLDFLWCQS